MTTAGWIFMALSCASITVLTVYSYWMMLSKENSRPGSKK